MNSECFDFSKKDYDLKSPEKEENRPVNLVEFEKLPEPKLPGHTFVDYALYKLSTITSMCLDASNAYELSRVKDNKERKDILSNSIKKNGFYTDEQPPQVTTDGVFKNGIGRTGAMQQLGEEYIPVAVFEENEDITLEQDLIARNVVNNDFRPRTPTDYDSLVAQVKHLIQEGAVKNNEDSKKYLSKIKAHNIYSPRTLGKVYNSAKKQIAVDTSALVNRDRDDCHKWIEENLPNIGDYDLVNAKEEAYQLREFEQILESSEKRSIILYTSDTEANVARSSIRRSVNKLNSLWKKSFTKSLLSAGFPQLAIDEMFKNAQKPYILLGCVPQLEKHNKTKLVQIEDY